MTRRLLTRREFLDAAIRRGAAVGVTGGLLNALACSAGNVPDTAPPLDLDESALSLLIDEILPAADGMPAASEVGVVSYFRRVSVPVPELGESLSECVLAAEEMSRRQFGSEIAELDSTQRISVLEELESADGELFSAFRNFVYEAYYVNPEVWTLLGYDAYPTSEPGPSMDAFDPAMLDRVRNLQPLFVEAE